MRSMRMQRMLSAEKNKSKGGSRAKKVALVNKMNPDWKDLYDEI